MFKAEAQDSSWKDSCRAEAQLQRKPSLWSTKSKSEMRWKKALTEEQKLAARC